MPCYFPLHAFKGKSNDAGKIQIFFSRPSSWRGEQIDLPCGQCVGCRLERSRQWAVRCMHEASLYDQNCFITLTYDDSFLPDNNSLQLKDFQLFMKRLRKRFGSGIRYYHCGEYGGELGRPHYHALLFNHDFDDRKFFSERSGNRLFTSDSLSSLWEKGFSTVGAVTFESAAYVARYVMKKVTGKKAEDHYGQRSPEYTTMSRRPGIGKDWIRKFMGDVYPRDNVVVRSHSTRPPRFYDNYYASKDPSSMALLKIEREKNGRHFVDHHLSDGRIVKISDSSDIRLAVKEVVKQAEVSQLKRSLED